MISEGPEHAGWLGVGIHGSRAKLSGGVALRIEANLQLTAFPFDVAPQELPPCAPDQCGVSPREEEYIGGFHGQFVPPYRAGNQRLIEQNF